ncbi:class I SAM-dependent DNA methyltransferase [Labedaea rhizosphaerae]|uniref:Ubiquinone/menaquinone biosynthesis C-methylase UbiE n=1 Tax=Labedaea rhizosphaerae TaxID=598644 RepID=A0A4V3CXW1_LABRH|nr:class I SAM-dependent methyltransferase [Labedaea rhizosphaerae]TDP91798.1 ubiquinone/menaquinone biosynthesis C-methylase UbiE [Labedaea rhizosphaerae]
MPEQDEVDAVDGYDDPALAGLYDEINGWAADNEFYVELMLAAASVLDVGCGTGVMLHAARDRGHPGRLCGIDPAGAMLDIARKRADIEWVHGDMGTARWHDEFELATMTGHAFQELVTDEQIRTTLANVRAAVTGRFVFETRNPAARAWEQWNPSNAMTVGTATISHRVLDVSDGLVTFTETTEDPAWSRPKVAKGVLRFLDRDELNDFLTEAGFTIEAQYGDWARGPVTPAARELITVARSTMD